MPNKRWLGWLVLGMSLIAGSAWMNYRTFLQSTVVAETRTFEITKGESLQRIIDKLEQQGIAVHPLWFRLYAYRHGYAQRLKAGEYELLANMTAPQLLRLFTSGKTKQYAITFPEGWTFRQIRQALASHEEINQTLRTDDDPALLRLLLPQYTHPEGLFFPDTYHFVKGTSDLTLLTRAFEKMQTVLREEWLARASDLPLSTPYEALILASIVEKETAESTERPIIAGVFLRRLQKGMLLQTDPTVIYGMGNQFQGDLRRSDLQTPTPYNTYLQPGLPPTPIAMPGRASIHAVMHPSRDQSLYFVARGDGTHVFSTTLAEHQRAVNAFQKKP